MKAKAAKVKMELISMKMDRGSLQMTAHYALIQVLFNAACAAIFGFSSVYLRAQGLNDSQIGLVLALGMGVNVVVQPMLGSLADRTHKLSLNQLIVLFYLIALVEAVALLPGGLAPVVVAGLFVLLNFVVSISETFTNSLAMEQVNRGVNLNFGLARGIGSVGYGAASLLLGKLVVTKTESVIMPFVILFCVLSILALLPFGRGTKHSKRGEKQALNLLAFIRENRNFCLFVAGVVLMYYSYSVRASYMYQIVLSIGGDVAQFGSISAFTAFIELPAMAAYPLLSKRFKTRTIVLFAAVCFVVRTLVICFATSMAWIYVSQAMQMVSYALFIPASVYYVNELVGEGNRNKGQTFLGIGQSISSICASLLGGMMLTAADGDPQKMLLTAAALSTVGVVILFAVKPPKMG